MNLAALALSAMALSAMALSAAVCLSQSVQPDRVFEDRADVTARDVMIEIQAGAVRAWLRGDGKPRGIRVKDLRVLVDGQLQPLVTVEPTPPSSGLEQEGRWEIALYLDLVLAPTAEIRWAASLLAGHSEELTAMGAVEIWVADPEPRRLLAPSRDALAVDRALSNLGLFGEAQDGLAALRHRHLRQAAVVPSEVLLRPPEGGAWARQLAEKEAALILARQDRLLATLAGRREPGARRAAFIGGLSFDLEPSAFVDHWAALHTADDAGAAEDPEDAIGGPTALDLSGDTEALAATLGARGWSLFSLTPPPPRRPFRFGLRLGKVRLVGLMAVYEEDRLPHRARAFLELGDSLAAQRQWADAADAYRRAVYHFYDDPRTDLEQARGLLGLGRSLERLDRSEEARRAYELAVELDPSLAVELRLWVGVSVADPEAAALLLEKASGGRAVHDGKGLAEALAGLRRRVRVTYQLPPVPVGQLLRLEVELRGSPDKVHHPAWTGIGTTRRQAEARLRGVLAARVPARGLDASVVALAGGLRRVRVTVPFDTEGGPMRLSWAIATPGGLARFGHRREHGKSAALEIEIALEHRDEVVAVAVEDLVSGRWESRTVSSWELR